MRSARVQIALAATLWLAGWPASGQTTTAEVQALLTSLERGDLAPADRREALNTLRAAAGGPVDAPATREAAFGLAAYRMAMPESARPYEVIAECLSAVTGYADDPRALKVLPFLARRQLLIDDYYGAHLSFQRLYERHGGFPDVGLAATAAHNAARALDARAALAWSELRDTDELSAQARTDFELARIKAGHRLGRDDVALEALRALEVHDSDALRGDREAVIAAAELLAGSALNEQALAYYELAVNIFVDDRERPEWLMEMARLQQALGRLAIAGETLVLVMTRYPDSPQATVARVTQLQLDGSEPLPRDIDDYLDSARKAQSGELAGRVLESMVDRMLAAGYPLETFVALVSLATESDYLASTVAERHAHLAIGACLELLISRGDPVSIAALSVAAERIDLAVPSDQRERVERARRELGLGPLTRGIERTALGDAASLAAEGDHDAAAYVLRSLVYGYVRDETRVPNVDVVLRWAESRWRAGGAAQTLEWLERLEPRFASPDDRRRVLVTRADLTFTVDAASACPLYRGAAAMRPTPWVAGQIDRCTEES